jgi:hypothetical protein
LRRRPAPAAVAALDANLHEIPDRNDDSYHAMAERLGISGPGLSPEGRTRAAAEQLARQATAGWQ